MLQIALQYNVPRMKQATKEVSKGLPLFLLLISFNNLIGLISILFNFLPI